MGEKNHASNTVDTITYVMEYEEATTRTLILRDSEVVQGWRAYLLDFCIRVNGTAWIADTMTKLVIESVQALGNDRFVEIPIALLGNNATITKSTSGVVLLEPFFVGGTASMGVSIVADGTATDGGDLQILMTIAMGA